MFELTHFQHPQLLSDKFGYEFRFYLLSLCPLRIYPE